MCFQSKLLVAEHGKEVVSTTQYRASKLGNEPLALYISL